MENDPPPVIMVGEEVYVELGSGNTPPKYSFMDVIKNLQKSLAHLRSNNEHLLKASEE